MIQCEITHKTYLLKLEKTLYDALLANPEFLLATVVLRVGKTSSSAPEPAFTIRVKTLNKSTNSNITVRARSVGLPCLEVTLDAAI